MLIITAYGTVESAVEAFKGGAFDYLTKPVIFDDLVHKLKRVFEYRDLYMENQKLRLELAQPNRFDQIVGSSEPLKALQETIAKIESQDYGYCESCGVEIGLKRLEARPTATLCIDCKQLDEIREKQMG